MPRNVIAEANFDIAGSSSKLNALLFKPERSAENNGWGCWFELGPPLNVSHEVFGESSLQALVLSLKIMSSIIYGSELYKEKRLGIYGNFDGNLLIPAPKEFLDIAPYPF